MGRNERCKEDFIGVNREEGMGRPMRFRPRLEGCVAKDRHFAAALEGCYVETFSTIAANIYRSLLTAGKDQTLSDLLDWVATEEVESFRLLGELILALGGDAAIRQMRRVRGAGGEPCACFLRECCAERRRLIDRYETLMSRTGDRVVRSILAKLLSGERRMLERLEGLSIR